MSVLVKEYVVRRPWYLVYIRSRLLSSVESSRGSPSHRTLSDPRTAQDLRHPACSMSAYVRILLGAQICALAGSAKYGDQ